MNETSEIQKKLNELKQKYQDVFATDAGKDVLKDILLSGGINRDIFDSDPSVMSYASGKQALALHIKMMASPDTKIKSKNAVT